MLSLNPFSTHVFAATGKNFKISLPKMKVRTKVENLQQLHGERQMNVNEVENGLDMFACLRRLQISK
jgi:hypothetical protein